MSETEVPSGGDGGGRRRLPGELVFCLALLMGALVLLHQAWSIAGFRSFSSAGVFPMLAAGMMVVSGAVVVLGAVRARPEAGSPGDVAGPKILVMGAAITGYLFALEPLGFVVSSVLFLSVTICFLHRRDYPWMILLSIVTVGVIYLLFRKVFMVVLPSGAFL